MHRVTLDSSCTEIDINDSPPKWMIIDKDNGIYDLLRVKRTLKDEWTIGGEKNERVCVCVYHIYSSEIWAWANLASRLRSASSLLKSSARFSWISRWTLSSISRSCVCVIMIRFAFLAWVMISELPFLLPFGAVLPSNAHFDWPYHQHWAKHP